LDNETMKQCRKKLKTQINDKIFCVNELEEVISLKCAYYSERFTDLTQFPIKLPIHFSQK
jgi:hypothetical protein